MTTLVVFGFFMCSLPTDTCAKFILCRIKNIFLCRFCGDIQILTEAALSQSQSSETSYFIAIESQFVSL